MRFLILVALSAAACSNRTEIIVGVATDLRATGQIDLVKLVASRNGTPVVDTSWQLVDVPAGQYELPGSFGLYSADGSETPIELSVKGYKGGNLVVDREATLSLVASKTLFLRMTLTAECSPGVGPKCKADESCVEGLCQPMAIDAHRLPAYREELVTKTECSGLVKYIVSSTGAPMGKLGDACPSGKECHEGTCWTPPAGGTANNCLPIDAGVGDGGIDIVTSSDLRVSDFPVFVGTVCGLHFYPAELTINAGDSLSFTSTDGNAHHIMSSFATTPDINGAPASLSFASSGDFTVTCTDHPTEGQLVVHAVP